MKKGDVSNEIVWTALFLLAFGLIVLIGLAAFLRVFVTTTEDASLTRTVDYITISNRPYSVAAALTHMDAGDRSFLEQALQSSYSTIDNASAQDLEPRTTSFMDAYDLDYYKILIHGRDDRVADISDQKLGDLCGNSFEGVCAESYINPFGPLLYSRDYGTCGVGRVEIDAGKNTCSSGFRCCIVDVNDYKNQYPDVTVARCGTGKRGFCSHRGSELTQPNENTDDNVHCFEGKIDRRSIEEDECGATNDGETPVCCLYAEDARREQIRTSRIFVAQIPLLYKDGLGFAEVGVG